MTVEKRLRLGQRPGELKPPEPASWLLPDGSRELVDDIDPIGARPPHGVFIGKCGYVRALHRCETFHRGYKQATMTDEKTFSHVFRFPNRFLPGGRPYGAALAEKIVGMCLINATAPAMVEVGGGLGDVADNALPVFLKQWPALSYTMVDISPALQEAQRKTLSGYGSRVRFLQGNAEDLRGVVGNVDLLLSNEILADLTTIRDIPTNDREEHDDNTSNPFAKENSGWWAIARSYIKKYGLHVAARNEVFGIEDAVPAINYGAYRLVESLPEILSPNGSAFFTEYASPDLTIMKRLRGHEEFSLHAQNFVKVAEANGFKVTHGRLGELLNIDPNTEYVDLNHVNIWLILGQDPNEADQQGKEGRKRALDAAWTYARESEKRTVFDWALTPEEFKTLAKKKGWSIDAEKLFRRNARKEADKYTFFALTKNRDAPPP